MVCLGAGSTRQTLVWPSDSVRDASHNQPAPYPPHRWHFDISSKTSLLQWLHFQKFLYRRYWCGGSVTHKLNLHNDHIIFSQTVSEFTWGRTGGQQRWSVSKSRSHEGWNPAGRRRGGASWGLGGPGRGVSGVAAPLSRPRPSDRQEGPPSRDLFICLLKVA